jgi:hypothetical protein
MEPTLILSPRQSTAAAAKPNVKSSPLRDLNPVTRFFVHLCSILGLCVGIIIGYFVGALGALVGLKSLIQCALYQQEWMTSYMTSAVRVSGTIVNTRIIVDPMTDFITYSVTVEYDGSIVSDSADNDNVNSSNEHHQEPLPLVRKTFDTKSYPSCRDLYESIAGNEKDSATIEIMLTPGAPQSGTPTLVIERKFRDFVTWHHVVCPLTAILGLVVYFVSVWGFGFFFVFVVYQEDWLLLMSIAVLAVVLMAPLAYYNQKDRHEKRRVALALDPCTLETEVDYWRRFYHFLGPTLHRKVYKVLFVIGIIGMFVLALLPGLLCGLYLLGCWGGRSQGKKKRKFFQDFECNADLVSGLIVSRRAVSGEPDERDIIPYVTFRYDAPCGARVEKEIQSKTLCHCSIDAAIEVRVLEEYPRSGMPVQELADELNGSCCANWVGLPFGMAVGTAGYFGFPWLVFDFPGMTPLGVFVWLLLLATALGAVLPQWCVLDKVTFQTFVHKFLKESGTVIVPCPETCRHGKAEAWGKEDDDTETNTTTTNSESMVCM